MFCKKYHILKTSKKWNDLGIETKASNVEKTFGKLKLYRSSTRISQEIYENPDLLPDDHNFLSVILTNSPIMCLDIEGNEGSVEDFMKILGENGLKIEDFLVESTLNGGLHLYFRRHDIIKRGNIYGKTHGEICFDVIFRGKSFTHPSFLNDRSYRFIGRSIFDIHDIDEIPRYPEELLFMLDKY